MTKFSVTVKAFEESIWLHSSHETPEEAEGVRHTLEARMPGAKIRVVDWNDLKKEVRQGEEP